MTNTENNILIVEDDVTIAELTKKIVKLLGYKVVGCANNIAKTLYFLEREAIDLVLLDINLGKGTEGIEIAKIINKKYHIPFVYFTSSGDMKTRMEANLTKPIGYVTKPFNKEELYSAIEIALLSSENANEYVTIKVGYTNVRIKLKDILWIKSDNYYIEIFTAEKKYLHRASLDSFLKTLGTPRFQRVHRSYAVNLNKVSAIDTNSIKIGEHEIPISRKYKDILSEKLDL